MTDTADHPEHDGTEAIETSRTVESERVQTRRRFVLGATATLGTGLLAGCSAGRTGGGSTDTAVDTDTPTRTPTPTDEPVEYPRRISDEEIQSMSLTDIYEMAEETEFIHPNNEKILEEVDYEQIEAENDRRVDQLKEVMKETAMETHNTSRNGFVGMLGVFGLSWVDNQGENMLVDEVTLSFGGRTPGIEMIYEDENGEKQISIYDPRGFDVEEEWAIEGMIEKNFYEDAPGSELNNNEIPGYALIDLEAVKETSKLASKDPQQFDSHGGYDQWIHSFENNFILGANDPTAGSGGTEETVISVTLTEEYWREFEAAFSEDPDRYKEMKIELSKAAHNIDQDAGNALNAKLEGGETSYEEIEEHTYEEITPQFEF